MIDVNNVIFIHAANFEFDKKGFPNNNRCQNIIDEISEYIMNSKIYEDVDFISLELIGKAGIVFDVPKSIINYNGLDVTQYEFATLYKIISYCKNNPNSNVCYIHTKGASNSENVTEFDWIEDVRKYHLYWNILKYKDNIEYLKSFDVCGAELIYNPVRHFSQNFWWSTAKHINSLVDPKELPMIFDYRHQCEFWIGSNNDSKYKSVNNLYNDYVNAVSFSEELYIK